MSSFPSVYKSNIKIKANDGSELKLNGIIGELNKQQLFPLASLISVESSSNFSDSCGPFNIVNHTGSLWESASKPDQFLIISFYKASVFITSLSIQSNKNGNRDFPRAMVFYGSKNGYDWNIIGQTEDKTQFDYHGKIVNFPVNAGFYNHIKIKSASPCEMGYNYLCMENLDIFGYYNILFYETIRIKTFNKTLIGAIASLISLCK